MNENELQNYAIISHAQLQNLQSELERFRGGGLDSQVKLPEEDKVEASKKPVIENMETSEQHPKQECLRGTSTLVAEKEGTKEKKVEPDEKGKKNLNQFCKSQQLKQLLENSDVQLPDNADALLKAAVGNSKKNLKNESDFYKALQNNNLISYITNKHKFNQYIKPTFYKI